ncbi:MAG: DUF4350 domain-containing protein [Gammaproteobacteria bacterium]|nr:DUF4350 domain-containing protein [Gammaproteobacteria bacterium]
MRERLTTLGCALAALLLLGTLALHGDRLAERRASLPTSAEHADNGLLGLRTWLQGEGVRTLSLRERFSALAAKPQPGPRGNLLIVSLPAAVSYRPEEAQALDRWIRHGNTLLLLAALRDRPGWARFPFAMASDLELLTELRLASAAPAPQRAAEPGGGARAGGARNEHAKPAAPRRAASASATTSLERLTGELKDPQERGLVPNRPHAYFSGVSRALAFSDYAPLAGSLAIPRDGFALSLAHEAPGGEDVFWVRPHGDGAIIVSGYGSLFSNRALGKADNARLFANIVAAALAPDGTVVFDDEHQGLSDEYDPARFYADPRLYETLAVILAVWLAWVLGATRLRTPACSAAAPREAELVRVTGLYLARVLRPAAAARRLLAQFLQRRGAQAGRDSADTGQMWDWLENHPRLAAGEVRQLRAWHAAADAGRPVPLLALHNLIVHTERQLAQ